MRRGGYAPDAQFGPAEKGHTRTCVRPVDFHLPYSTTVEGGRT